MIYVNVGLLGPHDYYGVAYNYNDGIGFHDESYGGSTTQVMVFRNYWSLDRTEWLVISKAVCVDPAIGKYEWHNYVVAIHPDSVLESFSTASPHKDASPNDAAPCPGGYDGAGNLKELIASGAPPFYSGQTVYTYDSENQLITERSSRNGAYNNTFAYDGAGNPTTVRGQGRTRSMSTTSIPTPALRTTATATQPPITEHRCPSTPRTA